MQIEKAETKDLERILGIYGAARELMRAAGNPGQWGSGYPSPGLLQDDIAKGQLYKVSQNGETVGVFAFTKGPEPDYDDLTGDWLNDAPYQVIHRLAAYGARGVAAQVFAWAKTRTDSLRIDTHAQNAAMRHLVEKAGFCYVGDITLSDGSPRRAYHWVRTGRP